MSQPSRKGMYLLISSLSTQEVREKIFDPEDLLRYLSDKCTHGEWSAVEFFTNESFIGDYMYLCLCATNARLALIHIR